MRASLAVLVITAAGFVAVPAAAQIYQSLTWANDALRLADQQALRQRDITITNDLARLDAQLQTNQALAGLAAQRAPVVLPTMPLNSNAPPPMIDVSKLASIPDAALAASNARVRAAAENRK
jgi:hypothetical protein